MRYILSRSRTTSSCFLTVAVILVLWFCCQQMQFLAERGISRTNVEGRMNVSAQEVLNIGSARDLLDGCRLKPLQSAEEFYAYLKRFSYVCHDKRTLGGTRVWKVTDGGKMVCFDAKHSIQSGRCHFFSFGIHNEWSFDDAVDKLGCKVYAFDPTMRKNDHQRSPNIKFFRLGLGDHQGTVQIKDKICKVDRYVNIVERLGLVDTPIDYLKMDIESAEIDWFRDMFDSTPELFLNIKQIGMEIHPGRASENGSQPEKFVLYWHYFQQLECLGFRIMFSEPNQVRKTHYRFKGQDLSKFIEVVWILDEDQQVIKN